MKRISSALSYRLVRRLSTTAKTTAKPTAKPTAKTTAKPTAKTTAGAPSGTITIGKARWMLQFEQDPDKAIEIYSSVTDKISDIISTRYSQQVIVQRLATANRFQDIEKFIDSQKKDPSITQEPFFCTLIRSYGKVGMFDNALKLYGQMEDLGTPRTCLSFNALLYAAIDCELFDSVPQLFVELPERHGFKPNEISYGALLRSYCQKGELDMAKVFGEMEESGVKVSAVTLTILFDALYKNGKKDEAERVWAEAVKKGCVLDVPAWNARISHAQEGSPETVKGLIDKMRAAGLKPDSITYDYLLTCYCKNDRLDEVLKVYGELEANEFKLKMHTFKNLIDYLCKKEDYARGYDVFRMSAKCRRMPDFETLKELVEGMMKKNMKKGAKDLIRAVKKKAPSSTDAWKKVEAELGLVSNKTSTKSDVPKAQVAAK